MQKSFLFILLLLLSSCFKDSSHLIRYEADGTSNSYEVSYRDDKSDSIHQGAVNSFWRLEFATDGDGTATLWMRNRNQAGSVIGSIYCDGKLAAEDSVSGPDSLKIEVKY